MSVQTGKGVSFLLTRSDHSLLEGAVAAKSVAAFYSVVSCQVSRWKLMQWLCQGCQGAGRSTEDGDRGFRINEL